jgi:hypothetical protein
MALFFDREHGALDHAVDHLHVIVPFLQNVGSFGRVDHLVLIPTCVLDGGSRRRVKG